jgi:hypothetical protein
VVDRGIEFFRIRERLRPVDNQWSGLPKPAALRLKAGKGDQPWIDHASATHSGTR